MEKGRSQKKGTFFFAFLLQVILVLSRPVGRFRKKISRGARFFFIICLKQIFLDKKIWRDTKIGCHCPRMTPVAMGLS